MPSSKGKPTDPKLREEVTKEIKAKPNKDGSGKGQMAAWKASQIGKEYEARGGNYENEAGSKNKPKKGPPEKKTSATKAKETKEAENGHDSDASSEIDANARGSPGGDDGSKSNIHANETDSDQSSKKDDARPTTKKAGGSKEKRATKKRTSPRVGQRSSTRQAASSSAKGAGEKRKSSGGDGEGSAKKAKKANK